jgi:hypothetical protein
VDAVDIILPVSDIHSTEALGAIDAIYEQTIKPKLEAIDSARRQVRWQIVTSVLMVLPPILVLICSELIADALSFTWSTGGLVLVWLWLAAGIVLALVKNLLPGLAAYASYRHRFKQEVVAGIFRALCPSATYDPLHGIPEDVFDAAGLFNRRGAYQCDDRIRGRIGRTAFEASEARRGYSTGTGKNARSHVVFRGLFFQLDFNQPLTGVTLVEPVKAQGHQLGSRDGLTLLEGIDPEFEREFKVYASNETEARSLITPSMTERLLALRRQADKPVFLGFKGRRAYVGINYGRALFEPGIARQFSKEDVREIARNFALVETVVRELNPYASGFSEPDDSLLHGPDTEPNPVDRLAAEKAGRVTTADLWQLASANVDDSAHEGDAIVPRPERTGIALEQGPSGLSITYGLRLGFWVMLAVSLVGALLAFSAVRAPKAPAWVDSESIWLEALPAVPAVDRFVADAPTPWLIVGSVVFVVFASLWSGYVRRVVIERDRILIFRGFRPFARVYRRPEYGRVIRIETALYIAKSEGQHVMNPTASPVLTEPEAGWLTSEMKRALRHG